MQIKKIDNHSVQYHFEINTQEFEFFLERSFNYIKPKVSIKGFRKGFVTRNIFEKYYCVKTLFPDAFNFLLQDKLKKILRTKKSFETIGKPKLVNFKLENISKNEPFCFDLEFLLKPIIKLCQYKKIELKVNKQETTEKEIQKTIDFLLKKLNKTSLKKEGSILEMGDIATIDFKGLHNGESFEGSIANNYDLKIGSNQFIDNFGINLIGMQKNEKRIIEIILPENYHIKKLASQKVTFEVFLHEIKVEQKNFLNDTLVKELQIPNIHTVKDLKDIIKKEIQFKKDDQIKKIKIKSIIDFLFTNSNLEIPPSLIISEIKNLKEYLQKDLEKNKLTFNDYIQKMKLTEEQFDENLKKEAFKNLKINFILDEIASKEKIKIYEKEIEQICQEFSIEHKVSIENIKSDYFLLENIKINLLRDKVIVFLLDNAIVQIN